MAHQNQDLPSHLKQPHQMLDLLLGCTLVPSLTHAPMHLPKVKVVPAEIQIIEMVPALC